MLFQVFRGGIGLMRTEQISCIPSRADLLEMQRSGHKFKLDGKAASVAQICEVIAVHKKGGVKL